MEDKKSTERENDLYGLERIRQSLANPGRSRSSVSGRS